MAQEHEKIAVMMAELGCTGDHIDASGIKERIEEIDYQTITLAGSKFMYCGIRMKGGFVVTGQPSACMDPANWREAIGKQVSFDNTFSEIWRLEAYRKMGT
jgi:formylmethanofuran dehydrogenase subunit C